MTTFTFKTREEYLAYRAEWKANYKALSKDIRDLKNQRKQFKWEYRDKSNNSAKKKTKVGENPIYDSSAGWKAVNLKYHAAAMLEELAEAKIVAGELRQARIDGEQKAA